MRLNIVFWNPRIEHDRKIYCPFVADFAAPFLFGDFLADLH